MAGPDGQPIAEVAAALAAQQHRRFIKTHTPLDGLVLDDRVTYLGVGRDPRDAVISMVMNRNRMHALHDRSRHATDRGCHPNCRTSLGARLTRNEVHSESSPTGWNGPRHRRGASCRWRRSCTITTRLRAVGHLPNVAAFHFADLRADLSGELVRLGEVLDIDIGRGRAEQLAEHATLDAMRASLRTLHLTSRGAQSHSSTQQERPNWRDVFTPAEHARYRQRVTELAPADVAAWAHDGRRASGVIDAVWP